MSVTANRSILITLTNGEAASITLAATENTASPGSVTVHTLSSGNNTITVTTAGTTVVAATIVPPSDNTQTLTLKGVNGDTGIALSKTQPASITFDTIPPASFVLAAGGTITGLRIYWT